MMGLVETYKRTPQQLFNMPQHFVIPLFQRPYVWKEEEQWAPLWKDIQRVTELRINDPRATPEHFLGAVVLQAHDATSHGMPMCNVIDGQQRLTTLQLLMDASAGVFSQHGLDRLSLRLEDLTHNSANYVEDGNSRLKLRHLNNDHDAFVEVMTTEPPIEYSTLAFASSRIVQAHQYFTTTVLAWLGDADDERFGLKAEQLTAVLQGALQMVTIDLTASENSQEIFETLNARGTPLTAADLVRNFVFQRLESEGADTKKAYREDWPFETKFWAKEVSVGRNLVSRSSLFLNQWLTSRVGEEISPHSTFTRFKYFVEHQANQRMVDLLAVMKVQADQYQAWTEAATRPGGNLTTVETAVYRMQISGTELLKPLLIWLHEPGRPVPQSAVNAVVSTAESWVVRRQLLRLSGSDLGRIVADLIQTTNLTASADEIVNRVRDHLARLNVTSTYWPGDQEIHSVLNTENTYRRFPRARLRSYLEAIENVLRAETGQPQVERAGFPIEHILPQRWQEHWPVESSEEADERQAHVHRLGNLTLLTTALNSRISNGPWSAKRQALLEHNTLKLTGRLIERTEGNGWDEESIDRRTSQMIESLLKVWPVPAGHVGVVKDSALAPGGIEVKHLVRAGLLIPGAKLHTLNANHSHAEAMITSDGHIEVSGKKYYSPSGAAQAILGRASNGWRFWSVADGRRLNEVRAEFMSSGNDQLRTTPPQ